jgi:aminoglycoside/choline kinase family phosphotransferase
MSTTPALVADLTDWVDQRLVAAYPAAGHEGRQPWVHDIGLIAGDASPRKYYRVRLGGVEAPRTVIAVDSPPTEKNEEFLRARQLLFDGGVRVPTLIAADQKKGYLLLEDLGDATLLPSLTDANVDVWYSRGLASLADLASIDPSPLEAYSATKLLEEMRLFTEWFVPQLLQVTMANDFEMAFMELADLLITSAQAQPQVLVHRDFHSRNLMILPGNELAVIDFQDAVLGPVTYDAVSLLKDCYVRWPRERQLKWLREYQSNLTTRGVIVPVGAIEFIRWFDLMGLQRHIKVLGIFSRLAFRDRKPQYLRDLPTVLDYTREALDLYCDSDPEIANFRALFESTIVPVCQKADWFSSGAPQ